MELSHPLCAKSIRAGPSLIVAAVTQNTFSVDIQMSRPIPTPAGVTGPIFTPSLA